MRSGLLREQAFITRAPAEWRLTRRGGVVDKDLKYFKSQNLYICDGSVIPALSEKYPTLTIMALAHRLAERLIKTCI